MRVVPSRVAVPLACLAFGLTAAPAGAHGATFVGAIRHASPVASVTADAFTRSGCTSTTTGGAELNGHDGAVVNLTGHGLHKVRLTWKPVVTGTATDATAASAVLPPAVYAAFYDKACTRLPFHGKETGPAPYQQSNEFTAPATAQWLVLTADGVGRGITWQIDSIHPPKPKKR